MDWKSCRHIFVPASFDEVLVELRFLRFRVMLQSPLHVDVTSRMRRINLEIVLPFL